MRVNELQEFTQGLTPEFHPGLVPSFGEYNLPIGDIKGVIEIPAKEIGNLKIEGRKLVEIKEPGERKLVQTIDEKNKEEELDEFLKKLKKDLGIKPQPQIPNNKKTTTYPSTPEESAALDKFIQELKDAPNM